MNNPSTEKEKLKQQIQNNKLKIKQKAKGIEKAIKANSAQKR
ncbi:hypothetical protein [Microbulbifer rhizosphaerae]|uniref:Uncharacterized protein n=1 Tax=Microbulbifer rhizosphaerae TaxID=1562603 RepID=A0A7W4W9R0_9GAMM|nr:hypothetical protein [Microbulbifer rhizosphaerae]MBB3059723.1 hypothetical protein [Microbulbifer rhizosphaerae]